MSAGLGTDRFHFLIGDLNAKVSDVEITEVAVQFRVMEVIQDRVVTRIQQTNLLDPNLVVINTFMNYETMDVKAKNNLTGCDGLNLFRFRVDWACPRCACRTCRPPALRSPTCCERYRRVEPAAP